ncbi:unnamed protein product [Adineta steineri]|uniref:IBB domain-containing protein n=1 Tax=Adineta steineri TaxID=433720 RepID=A0A813XAL1_9BILA|nr:unnamed protein product [Adineta steineri]
MGKSVGNLPRFGKRFFLTERHLNITLRKQKREEQHFKRRNLASTNEPETTTPFGVSGAGTQPSGPSEPVKIQCQL